MLSTQIAEHATGDDGTLLLAELPDELRDLVLHLIASHHGHARPFAPVVVDQNLPPLPAFDLKCADRTAGVGVKVAPVGAEQRSEWEQCPTHQLDSGVCDRFWTLTRRHGWWGLAYLEAILRLADRTVSRDEQRSWRGGDAR
jgi:CRISPR-associated endonuclease/helicase Cas3